MTPMSGVNWEKVNWEHMYLGWRSVPVKRRDRDGRFERLAARLGGCADTFAPNRVEPCLNPMYEASTTPSLFRPVSLDLI